MSRFIAVIFQLGCSAVPGFKQFQKLHFSPLFLFHIKARDKHKVCVDTNTRGNRKSEAQLEFEGRQPAIPRCVKLKLQTLEGDKHRLIKMDTPYFFFFFFFNQIDSKRSVVMKPQSSVRRSAEVTQSKTRHKYIIGTLELRVLVPADRCLKRSVESPGHNGK